VWFWTSDALRVRQFSLFTFTHTLCVYFFVYRRPTLILSNVWEIFQHFQKLGKGTLPLDPAGGSAPKPPYRLALRALAMCPPLSNCFRLVTPLARQPISCYYYACDLNLCTSSSQILATNSQFSFSCKPRPLNARSGSQTHPSKKFQIRQWP